MNAQSQSSAAMRLPLEAVSVEEMEEEEVHEMVDPSDVEEVEAMAQAEALPDTAEAREAERLSIVTSLQLHELLCDGREVPADEKPVTIRLVKLREIPISLHRHNHSETKPSLAYLVLEGFVGDVPWEIFTIQTEKSLRLWTKLEPEHFSEQLASGQLYLRVALNLVLELDDHVTALSDQLLGFFIQLKPCPRNYRIKDLLRRGSYWLPKKIRVPRQRTSKLKVLDTPIKRRRRKLYVLATQRLETGSVKLRVSKRPPKRQACAVKEKWAKLGLKKFVAWCRNLVVS